LYDWYVLYVKAGCEEKVVKLLTEKLDIEKYLPFIPMKMQSFRRQGRIHKIKKICFPGYIFIQSKYDFNKFYKEVSLLINN